MVSDIVVAGYDAVYAVVPKSPTLRQLWRRHVAGRDFPEEFEHFSFITLTQLRRMAAYLALVPGQTLVDLGCGMGGPALWMTRETGCGLIGIDASPTAIAQATARASALGLEKLAGFRLGTFAATGLPDNVADAAMSEDALQYAPDKREAMREVARVLRPGALLAFTAFELDPKRAADLPFLGSDPVPDYRPSLLDAGFAVEAYEEVPGWPEPMTSIDNALLRAAPVLREEMGESAAAALLAEVSVTLERKPYMRRVLALARAQSTRETGVPGD